MKKPAIAIIVAVDESNAIGKEQQLLVHLPNDLKHFKTITLGRTVIMGQNTFESLPNGALPNRKNIVLSLSPDFVANGVTVCRSFDEALALCRNEETVFIIGGASVYKEALKQADVLYLTRIHHTFSDADTFFPNIDPAQWVVMEKEEHPADEQHAFSYTFFKLIRK